MEMEQATMLGPSKILERVTNPVPPETAATPETRLPTVPQVRLVPDLTTVSQDTTMYASMFERLNRSLDTFITKLSKSTERG